MANTKSLVESVRQLTHEYQVDPISDDYIIKRLNEVYVYIYNHFVKSNDELFGLIHLLSVTAGVTEYDMPENLFTKRIEKMLIPTPPNESTSPWGWTKVPKRPYSQSYTYQTNRIRTYYPEMWCTLNNKIYIFPAPIVSYTAQLIISRKIPKLTVWGGRITELRNNEIFLDELNDSRIEDAAGDNSIAFISVCDGHTGEHKALFSYSAVDTTTNKITLQASPRKYATMVIQSLRYTAVTAGSTIGEQINIRYVTGGALSVAVSNYTITVTLNAGVSTANDVITAINTTFPAAAALVTASLADATAGAVVQTIYTTPLYLIGGENTFDGDNIDDLPGTQWGTIELDDVVCYQYGTCTSIFGEAFDSCLVDWAVLKLRGSLNESDPEVMNSLKLHLVELTGDLGGRPMGLKINMTERNFYGQKTFRRTHR